MPKGNKPRYREATRELLAFRRLTEGEDGAGEGVPESPARRGGRGDVPVRGFRLRDDRETESEGSPPFPCPLIREAPFPRRPPLKLPSESFFPLPLFLPSNPLSSLSPRRRLLACFSCLAPS